VISAGYSMPMREPPTEEPDDDERDDDRDESDEETRSAPTRAGSNVPNAGRDPDEDRTE